MTVPAQYVINVRRTGSEITGKRLSWPTSTGISSSSLPTSKSGYVRSKKGFGKSTYYIIDVLWGQSIKQNQEPIILIIEIIVLFAVKYGSKNLNVKNCTLSVQKD